MKVRSRSQSPAPPGYSSRGLVWTATCLSCMGSTLVQAQSRETAQVEEVIVTAQRRAERLQDVPISISVLGGDILDNATAVSVKEALSTVPGVAINTAVQGGGTLVTVRGVTAAGPLFFGSAPIAYYLDSVPFGLVKTAIGPDSNAYDLERIEVLRGPQGTLYGANALNGVVRVLTAKADVNEFGFKARTSLSSTEDGGENYRGDMSLNVPIVAGKVAARAVLGYQDLAGWIDRPNREDANDAEIKNGRLRIDAQPTENLSVGLSAWIARSDYGAPPISPNGLTTTFQLDEAMATDFDLYGMTLRYDFPALSLTSTTGYLDYTNDSGLDYGALGLVGTRLATTLDARTFSQEITLNSAQNEIWRWSLGAFYRDGEDTVFQWRRQYVAYTRQRNGSESTALFGELTRRFMEGRVELTAGVRYFEDDVSGDELQRLDGTAQDRLIHTDSSFDAVSPRVVVNWHPAQDLTVYASYGEGFRSGFDQNPAALVASPQLKPVEADTLRNYEVGFKGRAWDGRLTFDAAAYFVDWDDVQQALTVNVGTPTSPTNIAALVNGESASGLGVDVAASIAPADGLSFGVNVGWNDLSMDSDVFSGGALLFAAGERLNFSPEYTIGTSADFSFPLGSGGYVGSFAAGANYVSEQTEKALLGGRVNRGRGDSIVVGTASFSIESPSNWTTRLFVDNVNNEDGALTRPGLGIPAWATYLRPRTYGLQFEYRTR
jgi:iron complex outermembrane recepter protein